MIRVMANGESEYNPVGCKNLKRKEKVIMKNILNQFMELLLKNKKYIIKLKKNTFSILEI